MDIIIITALSLMYLLFKFCANSDVELIYDVVHGDFEGQMAFQTLFSPYMNFLLCNRLSIVRVNSVIHFIYKN